MPIASDRHPETGHATRKGRGAETSTNETPVSTAEHRHGGSDPKRPAKLLVKPVSPKTTAATGRDHPDESEHAAHEKLHGESQKRVAEDGHGKLQDRAAKHRENKLRKAH